MKSNPYPASRIITERRTIKRFKTDSVSVEVITELLNIAVWAPNHGLREPWRFILYIDEGKRIISEAISSHGIKKRDPVKLMEIPAYLLVIIQEDSRQREWEEDFAAASTLIQNFQLAAWERGLGVIWKTEPFTYQPGFLKAVGVNPGEKLVGMLQVGYPETIPEARPRTPAKDKLTVIHTSTLTEEMYSNGPVSADIR
ncbi:nitroreductase [Paenibacillus sp. J2TS4]|uniref:nitroreductase family protein n=1 Tax=Paenibacillus sp. J2TS4 TaxID=2807194 RepID=UPI001B2F2D64|nr:nitroreductase [Paenibacillus sp. J2TS4]GIP32486.1 nitroreductase [Paenibacillus sp. J2TS4]